MNTFQALLDRRLIEKRMNGNEPIVFLRDDEKYQAAHFIARLVQPFVAGVWVSVEMNSLNMATIYVPPIWPPPFMYLQYGRHHLCTLQYGRHHLCTSNMAATIYVPPIWPPPFMYLQ